MRSNLRFSLFTFIMLLAIGFSYSQTAKAQLVENTGVIDVNHEWPKYIRGCWDLDRTNIPENSCSYVYAQSNVQFHMNGRPDYVWAYTNHMVVWDVDKPDTGDVEKTNVVDVFPNSSNRPLGNRAADLFTVVGSNDINAHQLTWAPAMKVEIWDDGFDTNSVCDDGVSRWRFNEEFRYIGVRIGGPGAAPDVQHLMPDQGNYIYIDTIGVPHPPTPIIANFEADVTEGLVPFDVKFSDLSTGEVTNWDWDFGDGTNSIEQNPKKTYDQSGIFSVTLMASNPTLNDPTTGITGIEDDEVRIDLINAKENPPVVAFSADVLSGIGPLTVNFTDDSTGVVDSWAWDFGDGNISNDQKPTNVYGMRGIFSVSLRAGGPGGFTDLFKPDFISVLPDAAAANFTAEPLEGFAPLEVQFTDTSANEPTDFLWDFGDGAQSTEQDPLKTYENAGLYNVSLFVENAGGDDIELKLNYLNVIGPEAPRAAFSVDNTAGFAPLDVQFTDESTGKPTKWVWIIGDGESRDEQNPAHTFKTAGIYSPTLTVGNDLGISSIEKENLIIVFSPNGPSADFSADSGTVGFAPLVVDFTDKSAGNPKTWAWEFGDGSFSQNQNPSYTYNIPGIYTVNLTVSNSHGADVEAKINLITVKSKEGPVGAFSANPTAGFAPLEVQFTDLSAGEPTKWSWEFGDNNTSSEQNVVNTFNSAGFYTVSLTVSNGDGAAVETKTNIINVLETSGPKANFSADVTSGFAPLSVTFNDLSTGDPKSWAWKFGDGNISTEKNPKNIFNAEGIYTVGLTVSNENGASSEIKTNLINVIGVGGPLADFTADPTAGLKPLSVKFTDITTGNPSTFAWDFGDGNTSAEQDPSNTYNSAGLFTVKLTTSNANGASTEVKTNLVNVSSAGGPVAAFEADKTAGAAPLAVTFTDLSSGNPTSWAWDFGNGNVSSLQNPGVNNYNVAGLYSPSLTVSNAEGSNTEIKTNLINVSTVGGPVAAFEASTTAGIKPLPVTFTDLSAGVPTSWVWNFGDGGSSSEQSPAHTYNSEGIFTVGLTVSNSNGSSKETKTNLINVSGSGSPVAAFSASPTAGLIPLVVQFTDLSEGGIASWTWDFGDGGSSSDQGPSHTYKRDGIFNAKLTVSGSEGSDNATTTIIAQGLPSPSADFSASPQTGAAPLTVRFTDLSEPEGNISSWVWDFGDGGTSRDTNPSHNYRRDGLFSPKLIISSASGASTETKTNLINVIAAPAPTVDFFATPTAGQSPLLVNFIDISQPEGGIDSWLWDFGDGATSIEQNPAHTYRGDGGFFSVSLTASNSSGGGVETKTNLIQVTGEGAPVVDFSASPTAGQVPLTVSYTDLSEPAGDIASWLWDFGDGGSSIDQNPKHNYKREGLFSVSLTASNAGGASLEVKTNLINVSGLGTPVASFSASPTAGKAPLDVNFTDLSEPSGLITSFLWDFGDGATDTEQSPTHTYRNEGFFTVGLTVSNEGGANIENKTNLIFVKGEGVPTAQFTASPNAGKPPLDVQFNNTSEGDISSFLWDFGDGATDDEESPQHTYQNAGIFTVILGVSGSGGADSEKKTNLIRIAESGKVEAAFTGTPQIGVVPLLVEFTDNTAGEVDSWLWDFGDGSTSDEQNPVHEYLTPGDYTVTLTVSGPNNSDEEAKTNYVRAISSEEGSFAVFFDYEPVVGFSPLEVQFFDQTEAVNADSDSWDWDFGDGESSREETPLHVYTVDEENEFDVTLTVGVGSENGSFTIENAVKVVADTGGCNAVMSIKPDPANLNSRRALKASVTLSSECNGTFEDIICDSVKMAGASPVKCQTKRKNFVAEFDVTDLDVESGKVELVLTGETTEGDTFRATDSVTFK